MKSRAGVTRNFEIDTTLPVERIGNLHRVALANDVNLTAHTVKFTLTISVDYDKEGREIRRFVNISNARLVELGEVFS